MYRSVIFDMDGTLADTCEGIFHAYQYTMEQMGKHFLGAAFVRKAIGAPLTEVFRKTCGMNESETTEAIKHYRNYYRSKGWNEIRIYPGIETVLKTLHKQGYLLGIATLKKEEFAFSILEKANLLSYFDAVCGANREDRLTKADLIRICMKKLGTDPANTVLIGDSEYDAAGAEEVGAASLAVTYGFGFQQQSALEKWHVKMVAHHPDEMIECLLNGEQS